MKLTKSVVASSLLALVFTATAAAQNLRASIPFNFAAGNHVCPAGEYRIAVDRVHQRIELQRIDGPEQLYLTSMFNRDTKVGEYAALVFASYGRAHFLRTVRGSGIAFELSPSSGERAMAKKGSSSDTKVALLNNSK